MSVYERPPQVRWMASSDRLKKEKPLKSDIRPAGHGTLSCE